MKKKQKRPVFSREFPPELLPASPHLTFVPGKELRIFGVQELLSLSEDTLLLRWNKTTLTVTGKRLILAALSEGGCAVRGQITAFSVGRGQTP